MLANIGPGLNSNSSRLGIEDADADHVAGQHVGGELDALKGAMKGVRERLRQRGLADAGNVFDQQVAARQQRHQRELDGFFLALNDARNRALKICASCECVAVAVMVCNSRALLLQ